YCSTSIKKDRNTVITCRGQAQTRESFPRRDPPRATANATAPMATQNGNANKDNPMLRKPNPVLSDGLPTADLFDLGTREGSLSTMYDPELYRVEMDKIFTKVWLLLGHATEIPKSGDYVVRHMGEDEVIVARDRKGEIHVSLNVCPHRG